MDFFQHQEQARRKTGVLVTYFALAVIGIVVALNLATYLILNLGGYHPGRLQDWLHQPWWLLISGGALVVMMAGSLIRTYSLRGGGIALNQMLGARPVRNDTQVPEERRLINVVEEMAIASGMPVPVLFVLDEETGINAFVAGYSPNSATLTVTRGALEQLNRDELQGVIGHEFSHILNADMRINLRLIGLLAGILAIGQFGQFLLRGSSNVRIRSRGKDSGNSAALILGLGVAMAVIGWIGLFFGRLIKAAIARQREFLADASSVQFTRNPDGIAGALLKIERGSQHALLDNVHAEEMSHLCFGASVKLSDWFATHPPIPERIKAIRGRYQGLADKPARPLSTNADQRGRAEAGPVMGFAPGASPRTQPAAEAVQGIGKPTPVHVDYARRMREELSLRFGDALYSPKSAANLLFALVRQGQPPEAPGLSAPEAADAAEIRSFSESLAALGPESHLPLLEILMPSLRLLGPAEAERVRRELDRLIRADGKLSLFEAMVQVIVDSQLQRPATRPTEIRQFRRVLPALADLIAMFCHFASDTETGRSALYRQVMAGFSGEVPPMPTPHALAFVTALKTLAQLSPLLKQNVIAACADCILHDQVVRLREGELLRTVCSVLDCPLPPLVAAVSS